MNKITVKDIFPCTLKWMD